jgi:hypothetical protein
MRRRLVHVLLFALAFTGAAPKASNAQRVLGVGDDALVLPVGVLRFRTLAQWTWFNERYGMDTPGRANGALEPLGVDFTLDTIGVTQFPNLISLQTGLRSLTGMPTWNASLGSTVVNLRDHVTAIPFVLEAGLSKRFSVGLQIPYVITHTSTFFNANPLGREGNLGFNPALAVPAAATVNSTFNTQFTTAAQTLQASLDACAANPAASPQCPALNANRANAQSLVNNSLAFAGGVNQIYSTSPFVPIRGTDAQLSIEARTAAFKALYAQFGISNITTTGPFASQNTLTLRDAQRILTDSAFGIIADPLTSTGHSHIGDIDIGGKFSLFDSFGGDTKARMSPHGLNFRTSVGGIFRIPTSQIESPNNFVDLGTGRGAAAVEGRVFSDILIGSRFWQSFVLRLNKPFADKETMRVIDQPNRELAPVYRRQDVDRRLGTAIEFETSPRIVINDFFAVSGQYVYRHKAQDHYTGTFNIPAAITGFGDITLDASTLDLETETTEHRLGGGLSYSNLFAFEEGKAGVPFEVTYLHWQTVNGSGGNQPKFFTDQVQIRLYARIFGH